MMLNMNTHVKKYILWLIAMAIALCAFSAKAQPKHLALLLPLSGHQAEIGAAILNGFLAAHYSQHLADFDIDILDTQIAQGDIHSVYQKAVDQGADFIVGPLDKQEVSTLSQTHEATLPVLALNYIPESPITENIFYQFGLSPTDEAQQVAEKAWQEGYRSVRIITPEGTWGQNIAETFKQRWTSLGGKIAGNLSLSKNTPLSAQIQKLLPAKYKNVTPSGPRTDMIFLVVTPDIARQVVPLIKFYSASNTPIYATSFIYSGIATRADHDLDGVRFNDIPWVLDKPNALQRELGKLWPKNFEMNTRLFALGIDAYQIVTHLETLGKNTLPGETGQLSMDEQHRIIRQLPWAQFRGGKAIIVNESS
jgi:outer membrane PBP1 activator LpoA protein